MLTATEKFTATDTHYMQRAITLAKQGRFTTAPNPNVGCVIVKNERIIGEGFHLRAGEPHAEVFALAAAGAAAEGATCYVTLEPCSHYGRTPPCAEALVKARVAQVVIAMVDPNPKVAGNGIAILRNAGIKVSTGLLTLESAALNPGFIQRMQEKRPRISLKMAASLDGRTALENGASQWITSPDARCDVQQFRAKANAILSTASTVITDDASLNVRFQSLGIVQTDYPRDPITGEPAIRQPIRIILDRRARLTADLKLFAQPGDIIIVRPSPADAEKTGIAKKDCIKQTDFAKENVSVIEIPLDEHHNFDLNLLFTELAKRDINDIWVEAGATLAGELLEKQLVDELIVYLAPKLMGNCARGLAALSTFTEMAQVPRLTFTDISQIGDDLRIIAKPEDRCLQE